MNTNQVTAAVTPPVGAGELSLLDWNGWGFEIRLGLVWLLLLVVLAALAWWVLPWLRRRFLHGFRTKSVKVSFKGVEMEICPDTETWRIAHQAWVEIKSRKVGLPFDGEFDVITEVYDSWYALFGVLRDLTKSIPADRLQQCGPTRDLVRLLMTALNEGLRPHLTRWQAIFRRWYDVELAKTENENASPQDIQRKFEKYADLVKELREVNAEFVEFAADLERLVREGRR